MSICLCCKALHAQHIASLLSKQSHDLLSVVLHKLVCGLCAKVCHIAERPMPLCISVSDMHICMYGKAIDTTNYSQAA